MTTNPRPNPYVGARPYQQGETLYGRSRDQRRLLNQLIADRIVLLNSPSGAGKTSLIQAALIPELEAEQFLVLPMARVNAELPKELAGRGDVNRYLLSLLLSLDEGLSKGVEPTPLDDAGDDLAGRLPQPGRGSQSGTEHRPDRGPVRGDRDGRSHRRRGPPGLLRPVEHCAAQPAPLGAVRDARGVRDPPRPAGTRRADSPGNALSPGTAQPGRRAEAISRSTQPAGRLIRSRGRGSTGG